MRLCLYFREAAPKPTLNEMTHKVTNEAAAVPASPQAVTDLTGTLDILDFTPKEAPVPATTSNSTNDLLSQPIPAAPPSTLSLQSVDNAATQDFSLNDIFVALESIRPS